MGYNTAEPRHASGESEKVGYVLGMNADAAFDHEAFSSRWSKHTLKALTDRLRTAVELESSFDERLERFGPAHGELAPNRLGLGGRMLGASGGRCLKPSGRPLHLLANTSEELGPGRHAWRSFSEAQRSWNVREATGGKSRVRVHSPKKSGSRPIRPSLAKGFCMIRPAFAAKR